MLVDLRKASSSIINKPIVRDETLIERKLPRALAKKISSSVMAGKLVVGASTAHSITNKSPVNYAVIPNQFFRFAVEFYDFAQELKKYFEIFDSLRVTPAAVLGDWEQIKQNISADTTLRSYFDSEEDIELFARFCDNRSDAKEYRLGGKSPVNIKDGQPKLRSSEDCFGSVILTQINLPNSSSSIFGDLIYSLLEQDELYKEIIDFFTTVVTQKTHSLLASLPLPKPFLLLAGISGTGKTRFVREQALAHGVTDKSNYCLVPVRPDWHEPSDLLGYVTHISGTPKYIATDVLKFIIAAWRSVAPEADGDGLGELNLEVPPYWLCLDEMNLAPVEQYFADYLSVLESRKYEEGEYQCEALLTPLTLSISDGNIRADLGLQDAEDDGLWSYFEKNGIPLPPNLIVAGTVNMDETTHGFSRKVIDRALTIDFGDFFPNDYDQFFNSQDKPKNFTYSLLTQATQDDLSGVEADNDGALSISFLKAVNELLKDTPFELAYRALNELLLHVVCLQPQNDAELQAVWDDFLMSKILPRIDGDEDKLRINRDAGSVNLLDELMQLLKDRLGNIWDETRKDFFRVTANDEAISTVKCRSKEKLEWMKRRLEANTFTSFWP